MWCRLRFIESSEMFNRFNLAVQLFAYTPFILAGAIGAQSSGWDAWGSAVSSRLTGRCKPPVAMESADRS